MCLNVCACMSVHTGWSLRVASPNWGSNTAVLSLAFPSFSPRLCQLDTDKHRGRTEAVHQNSLNYFAICSLTRSGAIKKLSLGVFP